jgi:uncharacterized protein (TIGR02145 family)
MTQFTNTCMELFIIGMQLSNSSGLCPPGWHVPTDEEWCKLENYIERYADPDCNLAGVINKRGENTARMLKSCLTTAGTGISAECETDLHPRWTYYNDSTFGYDTYGFSALPGGWRWGNNYYNVGGRGFWWTSSEFIEDDTNYGGILRISYSNNSSINRNIMPFYFGYSVRCVKD